MDHPYYIIVWIIIGADRSIIRRLVHLHQVVLLQIADGKRGQGVETVDLGGEAGEGEKEEQQICFSHVLKNIANQLINISFLNGSLMQTSKIIHITMTEIHQQMKEKINMHLIIEGIIQADLKIHQNHARPYSPSLPRVLGYGRLHGRRIRLIGLLLHGQRVEQVEVDMDGLIVQALIIDPGLTDPVLSLILQEVFEEVSQSLIADNLFYQIVIKFLSLQQQIVRLYRLSDLLSLKIVHLLGLEVGNERLAEILRDVLGISHVINFSFFCVSSLLLENIDLLILSFAVLITVIRGNRILRFSWQLLGVIIDLTFRNAQRIGILNGVYLVLIDNLSDLFHLVPVHLTEMVLNFQFGSGLLMDQGQLKVVLIVPIYAVQLELLLCENALGQDTFLAHHLKLIRRVHSTVDKILQK